MLKRHLIAPGPTPVPESARLAMAASLVHHRGPAFKEIFGEVLEGLQWAHQTEGDVLALTCSGTGGFESAMSTFTSPGEKVLFVSGGKFGERWGEMASAFGMEAVEIAVEWGQPADPEAIRAVLQEHPEAAMLTISASETSTGVYHPMEAIAEVMREFPDVLFAVDGITAVGIHPLPMDELGIDVMVSGSQKAFSIPPGLAFVAVSDKAWRRAETHGHPRYYFDLTRERAKQRAGQTAFTPAISLVIGLQDVLRSMREEGLEGIWERHSALAEATRAGGVAAGMTVFPARPAHGVSALSVPDGVSAPELVARLRDHYGITVAGGQEQLKPHLVRIGHMGHADRSDVVVALSALESALGDLGHVVSPGAAVGAALEILTNHGI